ncbi:MAG: hypothetical protein DMG58_22105 [Acidobacteria bacterium]|nr:MAG: hypothetical protein DMG58_22105 [Acidobacteriota bacterium]
MAVAPGSIVSIYGPKLAPATEIGPDSPLAQTLGGLTVTIGERLLPLFFASPGRSTRNCRPIWGQATRLWWFTPRTNLTRPADSRCNATRQACFIGRWAARHIWWRCTQMVRSPRRRARPAAANGSQHLVPASGLIRFSLLTDLPCSAPVPTSSRITLS